MFSDALRRHGVINSPKLPIEPALFKMFDLFGENRPTMLLTKQGVRLAKGWNRAAVEAAALDATDELMSKILPYAITEIAQHRAAGRAIVMATTTPHHLVAPLAERLGVDVVLATRYGDEARDDGMVVFDGTVEGTYVWGKGKAEVVHAWAHEAGIDLADSYAYSDSYFDLPLLSMVGHPHAVNPDARLAAVALLRRWPIRSLATPPGVPSFAGYEPQQLALQLARPELLPFVSFRTYGTRRIPEAGPAIIVGNHRSYFDPLAIAVVLSKRGRPVRFLGKKEVFDAPLVGDVARAMGGIRVDRGTGSDAPLRAAEEALEAGDLVALMPQGTIPRGRAFFDPVLKGRYGAARLAQATGVPVIPVGLWGTEQVWPRSSKLPNVTNVLHPPTVSIRVGPPVELAHKSLEDDTERIMAAIMRQLPAAAREWREPTPEEIRRASKSGSLDDDLEHESDRRPGED